MEKINFSQLAALFCEALGVSVVLMLIAWVIAVKVQFFSIVDAIWSYAFAIIAIFFIFTPEGVFERKILIAALFTIWGGRLGTHLLIRLFGHYPDEDGRYAHLKKLWQSHINRSFFFFFIAQAISVATLSGPILFAVMNPDPEIHFLEYFGCLCLVVSVMGETIADRQLVKFKTELGSSKKVCDVGLWRYSRHPNYFFEWMNWVSFFIFACASPGGFASVISPVVMLLLLFKVTGIPATEMQALRTRGDAYRKYQERTSVFFPWFPKT